MLFLSTLFFFHIDIIEFDITHYAQNTRTKVMNFLHKFHGK